jgi:hypothetical protein
MSFPLRRPPLRFLAALLLLLLPPGRAAAQERYYLWIFSSQSTPKLPRYSHNWATFVRVSDWEGRRFLESFSLSWMPATLNIRPFALRPEPGVNLDLPTTLRFVYAQGQRISLWGPYEIEAVFYQRGLGQKARLESGQVQYRAADPLIRDHNISDCIHAISDLDPTRPRLLYPEAPFFGDAGGRRIAHSFERNCLTHPPREDLHWVEQALGISCYPIVRRG